MIDSGTAAAIAAATGIAGVILGGALAEWRSGRAERRSAARERAAALAAWQRQTLRDTRLALRHQLAQIEAVALGDLATANRHGLAYEDLDVNIALVGDEGAIRAYQATIVELARRFGRGLPPEYTVSSARAVQRVLEALDRQEERLLAGKSIVRVDAAVAPELFAPEGLVARLRLPWRLPSWSAVIARYGIDLLRWLSDHIDRWRGKPLSPSL